MLRSPYGSYVSNWGLEELSALGLTRRTPVEPESHGGGKYPCLPDSLPVGVVVELTQRKDDAMSAPQKRNPLITAFALFVSHSVVYAAPTFPASLVSYWNFDESASGTAPALDQVDSNNGTFWEALVTQPGLLARALRCSPIQSHKKSTWARAPETIFRSQRESPSRL